MLIVVDPSDRLITAGDERAVKRRGEAKPYQIRQFLRLVERYNLKLEEEP